MASKLLIISFVLCAGSDNKIEQSTKIAKILVLLRPILHIPAVRNPYIEQSVSHICIYCTDDVQFTFGILLWLMEISMKCTLHMQ